MIQYVLILLSLACAKNTGAISAGSDTGPGAAVAATPIAVPLGGNAYITSGSSTEKISKNGLEHWTTGTVSTYIRFVKTGSLSLAIRAKNLSGTSKIKIAANGKSFTVTLAGDGFKTYTAGTVRITDTGYCRIDLQGISKSGAEFGDVSDILVGDAAAAVTPGFANDPENFYWSRRGPSCHLNYIIPTEDKDYFYSELMVPEGEDKTGSYFMANGFGEGYFGIQVNSATERRVLFSVWDPAEGNGMTTLVKKGEAVSAQRFGGEGTGGQSYLLFNWQAGTTYKFLTKGTPGKDGNTIYSSWFFAPESGKWVLLATWSRPKTVTHLTRFHGFLENFNPEVGFEGRKAFWSNQWVHLANGTWKPVKEFRFSVDATGRNKQRLDFAGGVQDGKFFLQNGGFFAGTIQPGTTFSSGIATTAPQIDFNNLP